MPRRRSLRTKDEPCEVCKTQERAFSVLRRSEVPELDASSPYASQLYTLSGKRVHAQNEAWQVARLSYNATHTCRCIVVVVVVVVVPRPEPSGSCVLSGSLRRSRIMTTQSGYRRSRFRTLIPSKTVCEVFAARHCMHMHHDTSALPEKHQHTDDLGHPHNLVHPHIKTPYPEPSASVWSLDDASGERRPRTLHSP